MSKTQGSKNREKGKRMEYKLRDHFRSEGYKAHRVPSSGAAQGFPGDVMFTDEDDRKRLAELKSRAKGFEVLYDYFYSFVDSGTIRATSLDTIRIEYDIGTYGGTVTMAFRAKRLFGSAATIIARPDVKVTRKLLALEHWAEKVDTLVLHTNREPFLFLRYKDTDDAE